MEVKVLYILVASLVFMATNCKAAPQQNDIEDADATMQIFSGISLQRDASGSDTLNVKFNPGELQEVARTFEEGRAKIKKYAPLVAGLGVKALAVIGIIFGALTVFVTKVIFIAKLGFVAAAVLGLQRWISSGGQIPFFGSVNSDATQWQVAQPQWSSAASVAASNPSGSYPYARSSDSNDLPYSSQIESIKKE